MRVAGLDHVQIAIPPGGEERARRFYGALLGLLEVEKPASLATRDGCWFAGATVHLHLGVEEPFRPARKAHVGLIVEDMDAARAELEAAGVRLAEDAAATGIRRFYAEDPFGNRVEFIDQRDRGFTERHGRRGVAGG